MSPVDYLPACILYKLFVADDFVFRYREERHALGVDTCLLSDTLVEVHRLVFSGSTYVVN